jgi:peptidoglycan/LPS O-acetylase OafA/YrhL
MLMAANPGRRIDALDGWRTISILLVIFSHLLLYSSIHISNGGQIARLVYIPILDELGFLGVKIFFVISGFVICRGLLQERVRLGRISLFGFYIRRVFRIVPPLLVYVTSIYSLSLIGVIGDHTNSIARALTFTCNFPKADCGGYLGAHTWSLSVEEQFYLIIPVLLSMIGARGPRLSLIILVLLSIAIISLPILGYSVAATVISQFLPISVGVSCAMYEDWIDRRVKEIPVWCQFCAPIALVIVLRLTDTRFWQFATTIQAFAIAAILMLSIFRISYVQRILSSTILSAVGRVSYSIYLWQQLATYSFEGAGVTFYILSISGCIALAFALYYVFEAPLIRLGKSLSNSRAILGSALPHR